MKRRHLDANVVLRFLRDDDTKQSPASRRLIGEASEGKTVPALSAVTVSEIFYALRAAYKLPRAEAVSLLDALVRSGVFEVEHELRLLDALSRVRVANVDCGDAWLAASAKEAGEAVASFDRDFSKFADVEWYVPK
ncbi:MAG: PIN domain-containing protein [Undibacterium sp.]|nr:PIN domain-containing protein [Opitutaceae bacterium]